MIDIDSRSASFIFIESGHRFVDHYGMLSHEASQKLKPELRLKRAARQFWKSRFQAAKEMEFNTITMLDLERDNLFNSIEWAHDNSEWKMVCEVVDDLATYFNIRSYWPEWVHFAELAVADADSAQDTKLKAIALNNLSVVYRQFGRLSESIRCCQESILLCEKNGDQYGKALSFGNLGGSYFAQQNFPASYESYLEAIEIFRMLKEAYEQAQSLMGIGIVLAKQQKLDEAISALNACLKIQRRLGDRFGEAQALNNLGIIQRMQNRFRLSVKSFQKSILIKVELGDQQGLANSITNLAISYEHLGQIELAISTWENSVALLRHFNPSDVERVVRRLEKLRLQ
jgi:tetratricopeptide (TPR) repeat protein